MNWKDSIAGNSDPHIFVDESYEIINKSGSVGSKDNMREFLISRVLTYKEMYGKTCNDIVAIERLVKNPSLYRKDVRSLEERKTSRKPKSMMVDCVGIVYDIMGTSAKGNIRTILEDETGSIKVVFDKNAWERANPILDDVLHIRGQLLSDGLMYVRDIIPIGYDKEPKNPTNPELCACMLSDIHVGSKEFEKKTFEKFIDFLNGKNLNSQKEIDLVNRMKYVTIAGDLVDGIGIYKDQDQDLYETNIEKQYIECFELLEQIPEHIQIIISPGNHDSVRNYQPQPPLDTLLGLFQNSRDMSKQYCPKEENMGNIEDFKLKKIFDMDNMYLITNPGRVEINGMDFLLYHGQSFDGIVKNVNSATYETPNTIMETLLKRRNLVPKLGETQIAYENKDYGIIRKLPDVFHTGHIHINGHAQYGNTFMVNSGTFQSQTDFQVRVGLHPTPCRVPIIHMDNMLDKYCEWDNGIMNYSVSSGEGN